MSDESKLPVAQIPHEHVWKIVEYLSLHRVRICYAYDLERFTVCFIQSDIQTAQRLLDGWAGAGNEYERVES